MRIGVTFDLRADYLAIGYGEEETAEFDSEVTIAAICDALSDLGFVPDRIGNVTRLAERLTQGERWDGVFNFCEGLKGFAREAQVPSLLEAFDIPYVFSDPLTMALTLDKAMCKRIVRDCGVPTAEFSVLEKIEDADKVELAYPLFVKPLAEGSGKGINANSKVDDVEALKRTAAYLLQKFRQPVLVEKFLPGREFTVAIIGTGDDARVLGVSEILKKAKYVGDGYGFENNEYWEDKVDIVGAPRDEAISAGHVALAANADHGRPREPHGERVGDRNDLDHARVDQPLDPLADRGLGQPHCLPDGFLEAQRTKLRVLPRHDNF